MKRIFVAIGASKELQRKIEAWRENFSLGGLRWLEGKNLHLTLIPPWYENETGVRKTIELLKTLEPPEPFEARFGKITFGPDPKRPRLIWLEGQAPREIADLKAKLEKILAKPPEVRPFKLHLTIARFRPENFSSFSVKKLDEKISWTEKINSVLLMESRLSPQGADYEIFFEKKF